LGEHLLCKQGVVGSIPIASMVWRAWFAGHGLLGMVCWAWFAGHGLAVRGVVTAIGWASSLVRADHHRWVGFVLRGVCWCSWVIVNQVLVRFWARRTSRWVWAARYACGLGVCRGVRDGLAWVV